jgi:Acetyltransferase (GNAT) domain
MVANLKLELSKEFPQNLIENNRVPLFCSSEYANYLKKVKLNDVWWFFGRLNDEVLYIIPFCVVRKMFFKRGYFLTEVIPISCSDSATETKFLEMVVRHIKENKICDWIQQSPNWAIFKSIPSDSVYCQFSTYIINLTNCSDADLLNKMYRDHKQHIKQALKDPAIIIRKGPELLDDCLKVFSHSNSRKYVKLPTEPEIKQWIEYLPENVHIYVAYFNDTPESCVIYFSDHESFYAVYAAMKPNVRKGINHLLHWQAILDAKSAGIKYYNLVGSRISPIKGSKLAGLKHFKSHFGGDFVKGYLWKMPVSKTKYYLYCCLSELFSFLKFENYKGDIIDQERKRFRKFSKYDKKTDYIKPELLIDKKYSAPEKEYVTR